MHVHPEHKADRAYTATLRAAAPTEAAAFGSFNQAVLGRADGQIPPKYRELIALGVALTTQCQYCLASHTARLNELGATREEIAETVYTAAALRAGAAYTHGLLAMRYFEEAGATSASS